MNSQYQNTEMRVTPRAPRVFQENPPPIPDVVPGYQYKVRLGTSGRPLSTYQTMAVSRRVQVLFGDMLIVDAGLAGAVASNFKLPAPSKRSQDGPGEDGAELRIISTCNLKHRVETPPNAINGKASVIEFSGLGSVSLYGHSGVWIITEANGVSIR